MRSKLTVVITDVTALTRAGLLFSGDLLPDGGLVWFDSTSSVKCQFVGDNPQYPQYDRDGNIVSAALHPKDIQSATWCFELPKRARLADQRGDTITYDATTGELTYTTYGFPSYQFFMAFYEMAVNGGVQAESLRELSARYELSAPRELMAVGN